MTLGLPYLAKRPGVWRNPLAFPAGRAPGFDPNHVASIGMSAGNGVSAVAGGAGMIGILNGSALTIGGTPTQRIIGNLSQAVLYNTNGQFSSLTGQSTTTPTAMTMAAIAFFTVVGASQLQILVGTSSAGSLGSMLCVHNTFLGMYINNFADSTVVVSINTPYFLAASATSLAVNCVARNLNTGALLTGSSTYTGSLVATGTVGIGNNVNTTSQISDAYIAAAMYSPKFMPPSELAAWAADPWSFWYPDPFKFEYVKASAPTGHFLNTLGVGR